MNLSLSKNIIPKTYFLGMGISIFTEAEYTNFIEEILKNDKPNILYGYTLLLMPTIKKNPDMIEYCNTFELLVTDGRGFYLLAKLFGAPLKLDLSIPNMVISVLKIADANGYSVLVFGGKEDTNNKAIINLRRNYPNAKILDGISGYYDQNLEKDIVEKIAKEKPDILLIANSSPRKEKFAFDNKLKLNSKVIIPCGGMVDVFAGDVSLTPMWLKRLGLAWLYRLFQEPRKRLRLTIDVLFMGLKILIYCTFQSIGIKIGSKRVTEII